MAASTSENFLPDGSGAREPAPAQPSGTAPAPVRRRTPRHEIRALLRAHLAAASGYRHLTRHCAVCARLLRLAMEPLTASGATETTSVALTDPGRPESPQAALTSPAPRVPSQAGPTSPGLTSSGPTGTAPTPPAGSGPTGTAPTPPAGPGPPGATPATQAAPAAPESPESPPEQTAVHVMPPEAPEQTAQPVTRSRSTPSPSAGTVTAHSATPDTGPHALPRRPASARMTTRLVLARASALPGGAEVGPDGGDPGPDGRRGPGWAGDESPPAA
ncbi:DUF6274 family protein [Streptomyces sp. NPDC002666]